MRGEPPKAVGGPRRTPCESLYSTSRSNMVSHCSLLTFFGDSFARFASGSSFDTSSKRSRTSSGLVAIVERDRHRPKLRCETSRRCGIVDRQRSAGVSIERWCRIGPRFMSLRILYSRLRCWLGDHGVDTTWIALLTTCRPLQWRNPVPNAEPPPTSSWGANAEQSDSVRVRMCDP